MYINDFPFSSHISNVTLFADDATDVLREIKIEALSSKRKFISDMLNRWSVMNKIITSFEETDFKIFSNRVFVLDKSFINIGLNLI